MSLVMPVLASQSSLTVHSCPSPSSYGKLTNFRLNPSATWFSFPGRCRTSVMSWSRITSLHLACVELTLSLRRWSRSAWQSVLISTGNPYTMSQNLSRLYLSAANSRMNGLYFSSAVDVRFETNPTGCNLDVSFPLGSTVVCFCVNMPAKPYLHPSVVTTMYPYALADIT